MSLYVLSGSLCLALIAMLLSRGTVQTMIAFMGMSLSVAGCYLIMGAYFLATMQLMVYIGGVLVLMAYALMLSADEGLRLQRWHPTAALSALTLIVAIGTAVTEGDLNTPILPSSAKLNELGLLLMKQGSIVWELVGILLLLVLVGILRILAVLGSPQSLSSDA